MGYGLLIGAGASILGGVLGSSKQKKAAKKAKKVAKADAKSVRKLGPKEAEQLLRQGKRLESVQRAGYAGSNIDVNTGTPLNVMAETIAETQMTAIRAIRARNDQARSIERQGSAASAIGQANATGSLLGGISSGINTLAQWKKD